jgi:hypothetical protein
MLLASIFSPANPQNPVPQQVKFYLDGDYPLTI